MVIPRSPITLPFFSQVRLGGGIPEASQAKVTGLLMISTTCSSARPSIAGGTAHTQTHTYKHMVQTSQKYFSQLPSNLVLLNSKGLWQFLTINVKMEILVQLACNVCGLADILASIRHLKNRERRIWDSVQSYWNGYIYVITPNCGSSVRLCLAA